ncbi:unnamed protein product [Alternaria alternata]
MTRTGRVTSGDETECPAITHRDDELPSTSTDSTAVLFRFDNVANFNWEGKGDKAVAERDKQAYEASDSELEPVRRPCALR